MTRSKCLIIEHGYQVKKRHCYTRRVRRYQRLIRFGKSKKDRQNNLQKKKAKRTNNDLQNITHKTKDRVTRTPLKTGINSGARKGKLFLLHWWNPSFVNSTQYRLAISRWMSFFAKNK